MPGYKNSNYDVSNLRGFRMIGNIIATSWYEHVRLPNGKPDTNALLLLAEIVYWFRPIEDGEPIKQKFMHDKLHLSYKQIENKFGLTHRQTHDALWRLRDAGFITVEERGFRTEEGDWHRRLFINLNSDAVKAITHDSKVVTIDVDLPYNESAGNATPM